jgi:hypothetical protein
MHITLIGTLAEDRGSGSFCIDSICRYQIHLAVPLCEVV